MSNEETIWIGQDGQKLGPYTEADVRKWTSEGRFAADALAWHEGLADWVPLSTLFKDMQPPAPPPIPSAPSVTSAGPGFAASPASSFTASSAERYAEPTYATHDPDEAARADLPMPPSLHWGWVLVLSVLTLGIFGLIWVLVQANWVRKIDPESKALAALIASIVCFVVGESISMTGSAEARAGIPHSLALSAFGLLLVLAYLVLYLYGVFSMAGSMRRRMSDDGLTPDIGGVTLFFFNTFYLQGQMSWLARWKNTGATTPPPPKGLFYLLWLLFPIVIAILAAISIPAYQSYLVRSQVSEGMVLADGLKPTLLAYYNTHNNTLPASNAVAGLPDKITGRYVSDINIYNGTMTIEYANPASNAMIQQKVIVLAPVVNQGTLSWKCTSDSTVPVSELPLACRKP